MHLLHAPLNSGLLKIDGYKMSKANIGMPLNFAFDQLSVLKRLQRHEKLGLKGPNGQRAAPFRNPHSILA